jgi:hypothetical protein
MVAKENADTILWLGRSLAIGVTVHSLWNVDRQRGTPEDRLHPAAARYFLGLPGLP